MKGTFEYLFAIVPQFRISRRAWPVTSAMMQSNSHQSWPVRSRIEIKLSARNNTRLLLSHIFVIEIVNNKIGKLSLVLSRNLTILFWCFHISFNYWIEYTALAWNTDLYTVNSTFFFVFRVIIIIALHSKSRISTL